MSARASLRSASRAPARTLSARAGCARGCACGSAAALGAEMLEPRTLLAAVTWDGGGDGRSWTDPLNWSADVLPTRSDAVSIGAAAGPITVRGNVVVGSLSSRSPIDLAGRLAARSTLDLLAGASLAGASRLRAGALGSLDGTFEGNGQRLTVVAPGAAFARGFVLRDAARLTVFASDSIAFDGRASAQRIFLRGGADSTVIVGGTLDASTSVPGSRGGTVHVLGERVRLAGSALIDVSGPARGGDVLVGGDYLGQGSVPTALFTDITPGARILADATDRGRGGRVIVWSDDTTGYHGVISARGGPDGGRGGFVETSGKITLDATGTVDASAPSGRAGRWLLDPRNVTISTAATTGGTFLAGTFTPSANNAVFNVASLNGALANGTSVIVTTSSPAGVQAGDITVANAIFKNDGNAATLTLRAAGSIFINASISSVFNALNVRLIANDAQQSAEDPNTSVGSVSIAGGATISTNGGFLTSSGVGFSNAAAVSAPGGITINHTGSVQIGAGLNSGNLDIVAWAGNGAAGVGNLTFTGSPTLRGRNIELRAGSLNGSTSAAFVDAVTGTPTFGGFVTGTAPASMLIAMDAAVTDARVPAVAQYAGAITNMPLTVQSAGAAASLSTQSKVQGSRLTLAAFTNATLPATFNPSLSLFSITAQNGSIFYSPTGLTSSTSASFNGNLVVSPSASVGAQTTVTVAGTVNASAANAGGLTVLAPSGTVTLNASVGNTTPLGLLSITAATTTIGGPTVVASTVSITGDVFFGPSVTINAANVFTNGKLGSSVPQLATTLTINATGTSGVSMFGGTAANAPLGSIQVTSVGPISLGAQIATNGSQTYSGPVSLLTATTLVATGVSFGSTINSADVPVALTILSDADVTLSSQIGSTIALSTLDVTILARGLPCIFLSGNVTTSGDQTYNGPVCLTGNTALQSLGGSINFSETVDSFGGIFSLQTTIGTNTDAAVRFRGSVGGTTPLSTLTSNAGQGTTRVSAPLVRTAGSQTYTGQTSVVSPATSTEFNLASGAFTVAAFFTSTVNVTITTDDINLNGSVTGSGQLTIQPTSPARNISIGGAGRNARGTGLSVDQGEYDNLQDGFSEITFGGDNSAGTVDFQAGSVRDPVTIKAPAAGGSININTATNGTGDGGLELQGSGTTTHLFASIITAGGAITILDSVVVEAPGVQLRTNNGVPGGPITINAPTNGVRSAQSLSRSLLVNSGSASTTINGPIGAQFGGLALGSLEVPTTGNIFLSGPFIWANTNISFGGPVTLTGPMTIGSIAGGNVSFASSLSGGQNLTIAPGTGGVTFGGSVGSAASPLATITVNTGGSRTFSQPVFANSLVLNGGTVTFNNTATLASGVLLSGTLAGTGAVSFSQTFSWLGGTIAAGGTITFQPSATLVMSGGAKSLARNIVNRGTVIWDAGNLALSNNAVITNTPTGQFTIQAAADLTGTPGTGIVNDGTLTKTTTNLFRAFAGLTLGGTVSVQEGPFQAASAAVLGTGTVNIQPGAELQSIGVVQFLAGSQLTGAGVLRVNNASTVSLSGVTNFGTLAVQAGGSASLSVFANITSVVNAGTLNLAAFGVISAANYSQSPGAVLSVQAASAANFGRVVTTSGATLAGSAAITYGSGYTPARGTFFNLVSGGPVSGTFASLSAPTVGTNNKTVLVYTPSAARILFTSVADFDNSGSLSPADIFTFLTAYFAPGTPLNQIDINNDGVRSPADIFSFLNIYFSGF
jgi:hypothetical protein